MSNLNFFNNKEFKHLHTNKQLELIGALAVVLSEAVDCENEDQAWKIMRLASITGHPLDCKAFNLLYASAAEKITRQHTENEFYYQHLFKKHIHKIIDCEVVDRKSDGKNIPDAWIRMKNQIIPVEVKLRDFNASALNQLTRYMKSYNSKQGIAVARNLSVSLPKNIIFISLNDLDKQEHSI